MNSGWLIVRYLYDYYYFKMNYALWLLLGRVEVGLRALYLLHGVTASAFE